MPRHWSKDYPFRGFFENFDYYTYQSSGEYSAPSDWMIVFHFNTNFLDGSIVASSIVTEYDENDIKLIKDEW